MPVVSRNESGLQTSSRPRRLLVVSFDGTLAGGFWSSRKTVIPEFARLIDKDAETVFETSLNGVGANGGWEDYFKGGIGGWGTLRNVCHALKSVANHYRPGDRIILTGYSRGAWAARYLAKVIYFIGLPKDGDEKLFHRIYKSCNNNTIFTNGVAESLLEGYSCWNNVTINALCCFDTVGSLGLPLTGLAKPLRIFRGNKHDIIVDVVPNVEFAFHALSLHELREPFYPTLMRGSNVHQVSFPGSHSDLGWISDNVALVHGPLAWMIQQVHTHLGVHFDESELARRFPSYNPQGSTPPAARMWFKGNIKHTKLAVLAFIGRKTRHPGCINTVDGSTDLTVHIGARLRNNIDRDAVPGYALMTPDKGPSYWAQRHPNPKGAHRIEEAGVGSLEARLLGLDQEVVRN